MTLNSPVEPQDQKIAIRLATIADIPGILAVFSQHYLAAAAMPVTPAHSQSGFLLGALKAEDLHQAITGQADFILLVATTGTTIIGYALGANTAQLSPELKAILSASSPAIAALIKTEKVFFLRQIAKLSRLPVGAQLMTALQATVVQAGYDHILCNIVEAPVANTRSKVFHAKHGFFCAGFSQVDTKTVGTYGWQAK